MQDGEDEDVRSINVLRLGHIEDLMRGSATAARRKLHMKETYAIGEFRTRSGGSTIWFGGGHLDRGPDQAGISDDLIRTEQLEAGSEDRFDIAIGEPRQPIPHERRLVVTVSKHGSSDVVDRSIGPTSGFRVVDTRLDSEPQQAQFVYFGSLLSFEHAKAISHEFAR